MPKQKLDTSKRDAIEKHFYESFGRLMKQKRTEALITMERMAAFLDVTRGTVNNMEIGSGTFNFLLGLKVSRLLKMDLERLMDDAVAEISHMVTGDHR